MPLSQDPRLVEQISNKSIRQKFNESQIPDQIENGHLKAVITRDRLCR
jgi:hypothetical protein